jgi:hypothetical protein
MYLFPLQIVFVERLALHPLMTDSNNNRFVWKASGTCLDTGETVTLKGTIKEHSIYRDQNQTVLTRCKVQEK